jgi:PTS system nitrogen regulatory IIA component
MDLSDLLASDSVIGSLKATSKKQALHEIAVHAEVLTGLPQRRLFDVLAERERLGSTGVGHGVAIPHGKFAELDQIHALFARLDRPIEFESIDDQPVDLIFVLLVPEDAGAEHLKALARVSRMFRNQAICDRLRSAENEAALHAVLTEPTASNAA